MEITKVHSEQIKKLNEQFVGVDAYVGGLNLHADMAQAVGESLKQSILEEAKARSSGLVNVVLTDVHQKIEADEKEQKKIVELMGQIAEINKKWPGSIVVPDNATSAQLEELIKGFKQPEEKPVEGELEND